MCLDRDALNAEASLLEDLRSLMEFFPRATPDQLYLLGAPSLLSLCAYYNVQVRMINKA